MSTRSESATARATDLSTRVRRLEIGLRILGVATFGFFAVGAIAMALGLPFVTHETSGLMGELVAWSAHGDHEYLAMLTAVYLAWGVFLWLAAADPLRNRLLIEFTIVANFAHLGIMLIMAVATPSHRLHLIGDIPFGLGLPVVLTALWLPVRRRTFAR